MGEYWIKSVKRRIVADCAFIEILKTNVVTTWAIIKIIYFVHVSFQVVQVNAFFSSEYDGRIAFILFNTIHFMLSIIQKSIPSYVSQFSRDQRPHL